MPLGRAEARPSNLGAAGGGSKSRIGANDWAMEPGGSDAQYDDWGEYFWFAFADCGAAWTAEPNCLFHRVCWSGGNCGVFGGGGVVLSGGGWAVSLRARSFWAVCGDPDRMAYLVVAHFCLFRRRKSFHYVSDGVCAGGEGAVGSGGCVDGADWVSGGGELSRGGGWKMAEQFLYDHKGNAVDAFRCGGTHGFGAASGDSRDSRGGAGGCQGLVFGSAVDGLRVWRI